MTRKGARTIAISDRAHLRRSFYVPLAARLKQAGLHLDAVTANGEVRHWLKDVANVRLHGTTERQPSEQLIEERPRLQPIPAAWRGDIAAARPQAAPPSPDTPITPRPAVVGERLVIPLPPQHPLAVYEQLLTQWRAEPAVLQ